MHVTAFWGKPQCVLLAVNNIVTYSEFIYTVGFPNIPAAKRCTDLKSRMASVSTGLDLINIRVFL